MTLNKQFDTITLAKNGLILSFKAKKKRTISFSDLDEIYISVNKTPPFYEFLLLAFAIGIITLYLLYLPLDLMLLIPLLIIIAVILKMNNHKSYELKIRLKNGAFLKKQVPLKLKHETIDIVNNVRKEIYNYKIRN